MPKQGVIKVATCPFAAGQNVDRNGSQVIRQIGQAKRKVADVAHFSETALSWYAGTELKT